MLFNSYSFWAFFAAVLLLYRCCGKKHAVQNWLLLVASYVFYAAWDWRFLSLVWASTLVDFFVAGKIPRANSPGAKKRLLAVSVCLNLGLLGVFKYFNFFAGEFVSLMNFVGVNASLSSLEIILPVGISFYTFQTMSYTIDVYRGETEPAKSLRDFALFVCFFPQLVAGPIERFSKLMPQIQSSRVSRQGDFAEGLYHILIGLFKKVVIADTMAGIVNAIFLTAPCEMTGLDCLLGVYAFALQIYGDFSGYSSIAQGLGKWLGFDLSFNFRMPYFAVSPSDFWQRWHVTLSAWLRDYLYIPLGGNRGTSGKTFRNLMLTMGLGGLWHGAGWTYIAWGIYHGLILCVYRIFGIDRKRESNTRSAWWRILMMLIMFHLICISWVFFRAKAVGDLSGLQYSLAMIGRIVTDMSVGKFSLYGLGMILFYAAPLMLFEFWIHRRGDDMLRLFKKHWLIRAGVYSYFTFMLWFFAAEVHSEFIYFQF